MSDSEIKADLTSQAWEASSKEEQRTAARDAEEISRLKSGDSAQGEKSALSEKHPSGEAAETAEEIAPPAQELPRAGKSARLLRAVSSIEEPNLPEDDA